MTLTAASLEAADSSVRNSASSSLERAFRFCGRLKVMVLTPSAGEETWMSPPSVDADPDILTRLPISPL